MSTTPSAVPAIPPRHLRHGVQGHQGALLPGRGAARVRAAARAGALPRERAAADATVLTDWLGGARRAQYAPGLRAGSDVETFAERLADERRVVLEEGADPVADEIASAAAAEARAGLPVLRVLEGLCLTVSGLAVVAVVLVGLDLLPGGPRAALAGVAVVLLALVLAAVAGVLASRHRDRVLLGWAAGRPGQLGRGIPVVRPLQQVTAGPVVLAVLGPVLLLGSGLIAAVVGAGALLFLLLSRDAPDLIGVAIGCLAGGTAAFVLALALTAVRTRRLDLVLRRAAAVEWFGPVGDADAAGVAPAGPAAVLPTPADDIATPVQDEVGTGPR